MSDSSISLPSLLILAGISFVLYRFFFGNAGPGGSSSTGRGGRRRIDPAAIEQVASMFPQLDRRTIAWDLQRNGGNSQATVERMLMTGRLDAPPISFQPQGLNAPQTARTAGTASAITVGPKAHPNLITRYNLSDKIQEEASEQDGGDEKEVQGAAAAAAAAAANGKGKASSWSTDKNERATMMQRRKEQMILQARKKMEEKDRRESKGKAAEKI